MSGIDKVVERQMRNWELARAQRVSISEPKRKEVEDFVAISREVGAGGAEVAAMLAERLGWPVFDKEILQAMAGDDAVRRRIYDSMDERDMGWFEEAARAFTEPQFIKNDYFSTLTQTVLSLARQGCAVFLGRGVDLILPRTMGVRVRLVASLEFRLRQFAERADLSIEAARTDVARIEQERAEFIHHHFNIAVDEPSRCDLTLNREQFSVRDTVDLIVAARERLAVSRGDAVADRLLKPPVA